MIEKTQAVTNNYGLNKKAGASATNSKADFSAKLAHAYWDEAKLAKANSGSQIQSKTSQKVTDSATPSKASATTQPAANQAYWDSNAAAEASLVKKPAAQSSNALNFNNIQNNYAIWLQQSENNGVSPEYMSKLKSGSDDYLNIVQTATKVNGFSNPKEFVQSLSPEQLTTLQEMHSLAEPINPNKLDAEGALNLLLPNNMSKDLNKDGLTKTGMSSTIVFPPNDAPQSFKTAWKETTKDMDPGMRITMELQMWSQVHPVSINGQSTPDSYGEKINYKDVVNQMIKGAEFNMGYQATQAQRDYTQQMLDTFKQLKTKLA